MNHYKLAFIGFGNVGKALARLLLQKQDEIRSQYGITFSTTGITTGRHGSAINPDGIDLESVLDLLNADGSLQDLSKLPQIQDASNFLQHCDANVLFENTPVNYANGQPALDHLKVALELGMHAITANKGPVVHAYRQLSELAVSKDRKFLFESTVMDGAPIFSLFRTALPAARVRAFQGILNSTTNLILCRMETGESFHQAVAFAQSIGIAETDPSGDIEGWDAAIKVACLVNVLMGIPLKPDQVARQGIRQISPSDLAQAQAQGKRWKLVCSASNENGVVQAQVKPEMIGPDSPMFNIEGTTSIVQFESDVLGLLSIIESDPGPHTTAYGLLADFLNAVRP
ncbi:MAG: homoserine dehydrogenase [Anaerolineales bacterium]|nr:MAG: homoserine dehydrogenase [Anaerolineales bacterium]